MRLPTIVIPVVATALLLTACGDASKESAPTATVTVFPDQPVAQLHGKGYWVTAEISRGSGQVDVGVKYGDHDIYGLQLVGSAAIPTPQQAEYVRVSADDPDAEVKCTVWKSDEVVVSASARGRQAYCHA